MGAGILIVVPQCRQRTIFPRAAPGTAKTFPHVRFGHMILMFSALLIASQHSGLVLPSVTSTALLIQPTPPGHPRKPSP